MEPDFWRQSWSEGRTGFHQADYNRHLVAYAERMPKGRVLVPLAGKTRDIAFLTQSGYEVVAVELVPSAVEAFFEEYVDRLTQIVQKRGRGGVRKPTVFVGFDHVVEIKETPRAFGVRARR